MASDAADAVKLEIPKGFKIWKFKLIEFLKDIIIFNHFQNLKRSD